MPTWVDVTALFVRSAEVGPTGCAYPGSWVGPTDESDICLCGVGGRNGGSMTIPSPNLSFVSDAWESGATFTTTTPLIALALGADPLTIYGLRVYYETSESLTFVTPLVATSPIDSSGLLLPVIWVNFNNISDYQLDNWWGTYSNGEAAASATGPNLYLTEALIADTEEPIYTGPTADIYGVSLMCGTAQGSVLAGDCGFLPEWGKPDDAPGSPTGASFPRIYKIEVLMDDAPGAFWTDFVNARELPDDVLTKTFIETFIPPVEGTPGQEASTHCPEPPPGNNGGPPRPPGTGGSDGGSGSNRPGVCVTVPGQCSGGEFGCTPTQTICT